MLIVLCKPLLSRFASPKIGKNIISLPVSFKKNIKTAVSLILFQFLNDMAPCLYYFVTVNKAGDYKINESLQPQGAVFGLNVLKARAHSVHAHKAAYAER